MDVVERWVRHLRATGKRPTTIASYAGDVRRLRSFVGEPDLTCVTASQVDEFLTAEVRAGRSPATIRRRHRSISLFCAWLARKRMRDELPLASPPLDRAASARVLSPAELAALLGACSDTSPRGRRGRRDFDATRDTAMVVLLVTTGMTASELIGLGTADVDLAHGAVRVVGRGGVARTTPILPLATSTLEKYLTARSVHPAAASSTALWVGERGALTTAGLRQILIRRSRGAGVETVRASDFRRTFARSSRERGLAGSAVAELGGWGSARTVPV